MQISSEKQVKTLSLSAQRKTLTNQSKKKQPGPSNNRKVVLKSYLDNPFKLDWPPLDYKHYNAILQLLRESFKGFSLKSHSPPFGSYRHMKRVERVEFLRNYKSQMLEASQENSKNYSFRCHFVVGFNAVMRSLEKKEISCIFVNIQNNKSDFAERMFIPLCSSESIPLVPLKGLAKTLCNEDTLGVKRCRTLGLTVQATNEDSPFWKLYSLACKALGICNQSSVADGGLSDEKASGLPSNNAESPQVKTSQSMPLQDQILTSEQISSLHLKRKSKLYRVFIPIQPSDIEKQPTRDSFISFSGSSTIHHHVSCKEDSKSSTTPKSSQQKTFDASTVASEEFFELDVGSPKKDEPPQTQQINNNKSSKRKKLQYIPANVKRVKLNPNRKKKKKN